MSENKHWFCPYSASVIPDRVVEYTRKIGHPASLDRLDSYLRLTTEELLEAYDEIIGLANETLGRKEFAKVNLAYRLANNLEKPLKY